MAWLVESIETPDLPDVVDDAPAVSVSSVFSKG
jgi:hypothetical protein